MSNELVKDKTVRVLLNRRAEIIETINKLQAENSAIEQILTRERLLREKVEEYEEAEMDDCR